MKLLKASFKKALEINPENVSINVKNVRPYTKTEMKNLSDTLRMAERIYQVQVVKDCDVRFKCLDLAAAKKFANKNLFWTLFMQRADELLDSRRFVAEAKKLEQDPILLATNIVAHGVGLVAKVAKFGIIGSGINVSEFCCSIVPDAIVERFMSNPEDFFPTDSEVEDKDAATVPEAPVADEAPAA